MESKKQTIVAILALIVSTLSLAVSIFVARSQYLENIEVVSGPCNITNMDLERGIISCRAEVTVANTSYSTTSILRSEVYSSRSGFHPSKQLDSSLESKLPITLIQGGAEKISFTFQLLLDNETLLNMNGNEDFAVALKKYNVSIRFYSAKNHCYYTNIHIKDAVLSET